MHNPSYLWICVQNLIMTPINFSPGPSQLYFTVPDHIRQALKENIPSISHRSPIFDAVVKEAYENLRELLSIPDSHHIFFLGSANEAFERILQNLVEKKSFHFVNGAFSKRFYEFGNMLEKNPIKFSVPDGQGFQGPFPIDPDTELIAVTHNETSTGVSFPLDVINSLKDQYPNSLIAVDAVSSIPYPQFDYSKIDSMFFSVQKGFGLPAGLGVWIVNDRCIEKAERLKSKGIVIGSYHSLPSLLQNAKKYQTPETPNMLGIYLLAKVSSDMVRRGIKNIRSETDYKATILYQTLQQHPNLQAFVKDKSFQSKTVIVAESGEFTKPITQLLHEKGLQPGDGYGAAKATQLRFANFPTHSKEQFELLVDTLLLKN